MFRTAILHIPNLDGAASSAVRTLLRDAGGFVLLEERRGANRNVIAELLRTWCDEEELDLVLTIGGTLPAPGPSADECVPEATLSVLDRLAPGISETMRADASVDNRLALLDRGVAGIRSRTLIVNLPEGDAAALFLGCVVDLLPAYVAHLQGNADAPRLHGFEALADEEAVEETADETARPGKGLDAEEFAAFLQRPRAS